MIGLELIFRLDGFGAVGDLERQTRISELLIDEMPKRKLGYWVGDSIGSGSFEIGVEVYEAGAGQEGVLQILREHGYDVGVSIEET